MKGLKYMCLGLLGVVLLGVVIATPLVINARSDAERMYDTYARYTEQVLGEHFELAPRQIRPEYQVLHPWKFLKLFRLAVTSRTCDRLARVNTIDATMFLFMKMYTMLIRPDYRYNLPMLSVDFIFMGDSRVFVIEVIDPARIPDDNKERHYDAMRAWGPTVARFEQSGVRDWYKEFLTDFSIHIKADASQDDTLLKIYTSFLEEYVAMAENARELGPEGSAAMKAGLERYVSTLLSEGGPAVDVFRQMLGPEGQQEYVRTVMFGLDQ